MRQFDLKGTPRIAIVYPEPILSTVPGLCHFIEKLAEIGAIVDIYTSFSLQYEQPSFLNSSIHVFNLNYPKWYKRKFPLILVPSRSILKAFFFWRYLSGKKYKLIIGVDPSGIISASENNTSKTPLGYFSLELLIDEELKENEKELRLMEKKAIEKAKYLFISDTEREEIFIKYNPNFNGETILVPNTPSPEEEIISNLKLPANKMIVNVSGSSAAWTGIDNIIASTDYWKNDFVLVVHCKSDLEKQTLIARNEKLLLNEKILLTNSSFRRKQYTSFISKIDIGIVFYLPRYTDRYDGINLLFIGKSSGKLAYYLMNGKPVVFNNVPYYKKLLEKYEFGIMINEIADKQEIAEALEKIQDNYSYYAKEALRCFQNEFDLRKPVLSFLEVIQS